MSSSALWVSRSRAPVGGASAVDQEVRPRGVPEAATLRFDYKGVGDTPGRASLYSHDYHQPFSRDDLLDRGRAEILETSVAKTESSSDLEEFQLIMESNSAEYRAQRSSAGAVRSSPTVLISRELTLRNPSLINEDKLNDWYRDEHIPLLSRVRGWQRTRCYKSSPQGRDPEPSSATIYLALHEYVADNGLGGAEHKASMATPWRNQVMDELVGTQSRAIYELENGTDSSVGSTTKSSTSLPVQVPLLATYSYIRTDDGVVLPYRLVGSTDSSTPVILLSNPLLTSWDVWDPFVAAFLTKHPEYRILCYNTRGRTTLPTPPGSSGATPVTLSLLAGDIVTLLEKLKISRVQALMGCSIGGATTLTFALEHPTYLSRFVAVDCADMSSSANSAAWDERVKIAEDPSQGIDVLATKTVERWFAPRELTEAEAVLRDFVAAMISGNSVQGFREECKALYDYELRQKLPSCQVPGMLVVGEEDGVMPQKMEEFRAHVGPSPDGVPLVRIAQAGHVPMLEQTGRFLDAVEEFLVGPCSRRK